MNVPIFMCDCIWEEYFGTGVVLAYKKYKVLPIPLMQPGSNHRKQVQPHTP